MSRGFDSPCCPFCHAIATLYWRGASICRCSQCSLLFRSQLRSEEDLWRLYNRAWQEPHEHTSETGGTRLDLARTYAGKLLTSVGLGDMNGLRILDFGAGRGAIVAVVSDLGAEAYGVEPFGHGYLQNRGLKAYRTLEDIPEGMFFDGIITIDVIEHLLAPWNELRRLRHFLKDNGWIYIATLNSNGLNARLHKSRWREVRKPGHLYFFTPRSVEAILHNCGFRRYSRLRWFIQYSSNPLRTSLHYVLQALRLDGELRYLAWK